jgi:hypothetical protein
MITRKRRVISGLTNQVFCARFRLNAPAETLCTANQIFLAIRKLNFITGKGVNFGNREKTV